MSSLSERKPKEKDRKKKVKKKESPELPPCPPQKNKTSIHSRLHQPAWPPQRPSPPVFMTSVSSLSIQSCNSLTGAHRQRSCPTRLKQQSAVHPNAPDNPSFCSMDHKQLVHKGRVLLRYMYWCIYISIPMAPRFGQHVAIVSIIAGLRPRCTLLSIRFFIISITTALPGHCYRVAVLHGCIHGHASSSSIRRG